MKALLKEIKKNPQETNSEKKKARIQINDLEHKEEINIQPEQNKGTKWRNRNSEKLGEFKKTLGHVQRANIQIIGEEQAIENLFEKIMKLP